jgi:hypothetical protein
MNVDASGFASAVAILVGSSALYCFYFRRLTSKFEGIRKVWWGRPVLAVASAVLGFALFFIVYRITH